MGTLPPMNGQLASAKALLKHIAPDDRDDAIQEGWCAHLEGKSAFDAINRFAQSRRRQKSREWGAPDPRQLMHPQRSVRISQLVRETDAR